ncbi:hypothetical protein M9H77_34858 [Catharanthus roseus]|uniref:Uncharacterized protein n=1 Tax=Catharanthus roseus TaxID=4058 RepID=A0ACB9ZN24_CATRO|nr:hypothetical protein M9H77_34858 [Catharanthus roseus]
MVEFLIVSTSSLYNCIMGGSSLNQFQAKISTCELSMDIPMGQEIYMIYGDKKKAQECYFAIVQEVEREEDEYELFVLDQLKPEQTMHIGRALLLALRIKLDELLFEYKDIFAWSSIDCPQRLYRTMDNYPLLKCVNEEDGRYVLCKIHKGICGSHIESRALVTKAMSYSMTRKAQPTVELLQGPVTRAMARRMEEEHQGKIAGFKKMIRDVAWQVIGDQEEDFKRSKTFLWSSVQVKEFKEASLGRLEASKTKKGAISGPYCQR